MRPPRRVQLEVIRRPGAMAVLSGKRSHYAFHWHHHPELELTLIISGAGLRHVGDSVLPFGPGDLCLLGAHLPHSWVSPPGLGQVDCVAIQFPATLGLDSPDESRLLAELAERARCGLFIGDSVRADIAASVARMPAASPLARLGLLLDLLDRIHRAHDHQSLSLTPGEAAGAGAAANDRRLARVLGLISAQADQDLPMTRAAAAAGLSPTAFSRWFRQRMGRTFVDYRAGVRIGEACRRLAGDQPATDAAFAAGFGNLASFNRWFRRLKGMTPREYRRMARLA
jgi:AraC-like DNA-binding protein/mannose-6-phosphate isomerase-like protein (cupin superfamily)